MAEPATTGVAGAAVAGVSAVVLHVLGVEPQPIFWALIGATLGLSLAGQATRVRAVAVFACVVLGSALLGTWVAHEVFAANAIARNALALVVAALFHPLLNAAVSVVPTVIAGVLKLLRVPQP